MVKMEWKKLLSTKRVRKTETPLEPFRNDFEKDYERVVSSSSLRRLQDKAQVFPLQENDFTRTRLTHSIEVSSIAKSLGKRVAYNLIANGYMDELQGEKLTSLLSVCGLVHDLGNPPFGHYGEDIIKNWFESNKKKFSSIGNKIDDFCCFDGNAQTIRILSKLQYMKDAYGINFCYGTLATLLKYPQSSHEVIKEKILSKRKIGFFESEKFLFEDIISETGMKDLSGNKIMRHPATYLLEAADDIAYLFADLEDAVKKDYAIWGKLKKDLFKVLDKTDDFNFVHEKIKKMVKTNNQRLPENDCVAIEASYFRVLCQGKCIELVCNEFVDNYEFIINGQYYEQTKRKSLCDAIPVISKIRDKCVMYAYQNSEVLSLEIIAKNVLETLLEKFIHAAMDENYKDKRTESGKIYSKISQNFLLIQKFNKNGRYIKNKKIGTYEQIQTVIDYISGMTDSYALNLHKTLLGTKLP